MQDGISKEGRALGEIIAQGRLSDLQRMLDAGFDLTQQVHPGHRALDFAAMMGQPDACAKLIERGADVNYQRVFGTGETYDCGPSALHHAALQGYPSVVELLLSNGADPNLTTFRGARAIHYAVGNHFNFAQWVPIAQLLLTHGADANAVMDRWTDGRHWTNAPGYAKTHGGIPLFITPLHAALEVSERFQANQGVRDGAECRGHPCGGANVVKALLEHGANPHFAPDEPPPIYLTPFQQALKSAPAEDVELMIAHGPVDLGQRTVAGRTLTQLTAGRPAARALVMSMKTANLLQRGAGFIPADLQSTRTSRYDVSL
jgi:hypothetical protein